MIFKAINLTVNYTKGEYAVAENQSPVFGWGVCGKEQSAYRIRVTFGEVLLWDSGFVESEETIATYNGKELPSGARLYWKIQLKDKDGKLSRYTQSCFKTACFDDLRGEWIESPYEKDFEVHCFSRAFNIEKRLDRAVLYHCGLGLSKAYLNGDEVDNYRLQPLHTNYAKDVFYVTTPIDIEKFNAENELEILVAGGWRTNYGSYLDNMSADRKIEFMGKKCLWAMLVLYYTDGEKEIISSDSDWECTTDHITSSHLFDGEVYDETAVTPPKKTVLISDFRPIRLSAQYLEPVCVKRELVPQNSYFVNGKTIYDFGENFAGVVRFRAEGNCRNVKFVLRHSEEINEKGDLFCDTLRSAKACDTYICNDGYCNIDFTPQFTYHGFRYASLQIDGEFDGDVEISALNFYTDIDTDGFFKCGNQTVTEFYNTAVRTERANLHAVATDCPQRDERMAWMNDATVRFMAMPYNFNCIRLFEKIAGDIVNEQGKDGTLTCTAPFVYGERPSDPVCCAGLIAVMEHYKMTGDKRFIEKYYDNFRAWCDYLKMRAPEGIMDYSYYGDWAGPEDCCYCEDKIGNSDADRLEGYEPGAANSKFIPGQMMSTAMYYMTLTIAEKFSELIGRADDYAVEKNRIKAAFLDKWFDEKTACVGKGTQGEQALALFTNLVPDEYKNTAAKVMAEAVVADGTRIKTGNLVTPMLFEMLSEFGYKDIAWTLISNTEYPSFGYMLSNGATTMWERFELKEDAGMNSHNHPMYGASVMWLYNQLAGFKVIKPNKEYVLSPKIPDELLYFEMCIPLICGNIYLKCEKKYGKINLYIDIPFSVAVTMDIGGEQYRLSQGFNAITI